MSFDPLDFQSSSKPTKTTIQTANGSFSRVEGAGSIELTPTLKLENCLYVPSLSHKLLSVSHVTKELNCTVLMHPHFCLLQDIRTGRIIGRGTEHDGLYYVDEVVQQGTVMLAHGTIDRQLWLWHRRLGHPSIGYLQSLFPQFSKQNIHFSCETCILAKSHRKSFYPSNTRTDKPFSLVHSDVWGPTPQTSKHGFSYFVSFIDDCTRMTWVFFLKKKSEVFEKFVSFYTLVQTQFQTQIQILRSDNGGEFVNSTMQKFFQDHGLIHQTTCPYSPQQNGVAERKNRIILEITRALMIDSSVPKYFWPEAVATATYLLNRLPTKILKQQTPIQTLTEYAQVPPALTLLPRIFGCTVYVHIPKSKRDKLDPCAVKCVFVGYGINQKGYRCFDPVSQRMYTTMDCDFLETKFFFHNHLSDQGENTTVDPLSWLISPGLGLSEVVSTEPVDEVTGPTMEPEPISENMEQQLDMDVSTPELSSLLSENSESTEVSITQNENSNVELSDPLLSTVSVEPTDQGVQPQEKYMLPPRSTRGVPPKRYEPEYQPRRSRYPVANVDRGSLSQMAKAFNAVLYSEKIPRTLEEAQESQVWREAMQVEMQALEKNNTWEKCRLPQGVRPVGCKWVFTIKHKADGTVERYKARLVAKGYTQTYGIDYSETFSPVAKIDTIRVLFSVAANQNWPLYQFDVKNAFLHGELKEEVYMEAPPGFSYDFRTGEGCRLKKALYGLKQSPRAWFGRFTLAMKGYGYHQSNSDHTLFLKRKGDCVTCLIIYVDDMIITGNDREEIGALREKLFEEFEMKDLGKLKYFLGIEVLRSSLGIFISQKKYILDLLAETGLVDCKPVDTPMMVNHGLQIREGVQLADQGLYQRLVGKLIYLSHTRPDIAYAVGVVSQFMHQPQVDHMEAALRIVKYLKGSPGRGVLFKQNGHLKIEAYTDADWAGNPNDRRSTSGYFTLVGGNLVTWKSKKQKVVALSSAEAEFRGIARGLAEVLWLRKLLTEIGFPPRESSDLRCDNRAAISISENPVQHDRTKHVEVDRHFIKEKIEEGVISLPFVRSEEQLADILTKAVPARMFLEILGKLSIGDPTTQLEGECQKIKD